MAKFEVDFQVQGVGSVDLPVTPLDDLIVLVNGLEQKTFRFLVQNTLDHALVFGLSAVKAGGAADKVSVTFDSDTLTIDVAGTATVTTTITPSEPLLEGDVLSVHVTGTEVIV